VNVDVRILAATHQDLEALIRAGRFREDLFYRLNVIPLRTPSLRERKEDIFELALFFLGRHAKRIDKGVTRLDEETVEALVAYDWPGNIRELGNVIERSVIVSRGGTLELGDWIVPQASGSRAEPATMAGGGRTLEQLERARILEALDLTKWRVSGPKGAAVRLGLKPTTLESRMKRLGIVRPG
jgi:DNA-binding NtrC family response regulator